MWAQQVLPEWAFLPVPEVALAIASAAGLWRSTISRIANADLLPMSTSSHPAHLKLFAALLDFARAGKETRAALDYRIPVTAYTSQQQFERERALFAATPLSLGHESQIPEPGDAIVHDALGAPLVTVRDRDGQIATFLNVCRHRGMRLLAQTGQTRLRALMCPYHHWTYALDGELKSVPLQASFKGLDKQTLGLVKMPTQVRHGMIWVQLTPGGQMNLDAHLAGIGADLDAFGIPTAVHYRQHARSIKCNWKLIQDAFLDGYHVTRLHRKTIGPYFPDSLAVTEVDGTHIRSAVARKEIFDALALPPEQWDLRGHATYSYTIFPNSIFIMHPDYTSHIALYPRSADETVFVHNMLVPEMPNTDKGRAHYDASFELIDGGVFEAEDIFVSEGAQAGMGTGTNTHLRVGGHELGLVQFHEILARELPA